MKQRKTKTYIIDGKKYRFNHSDFKKLYLFKLSQDKSLELVKSEQEFRENMASAICTSVEAIKKWRYGINSPGDTEIISDIEKYFHVKQGRLLIEEATEFKTEDKVMSSRMITDYERNAVRTLYQGLVACINEFEENDGTSFDDYGEEFWRIIDSTLNSFRKNMMDVPNRVYEGLFRILKIIITGSDDDTYYETFQLRGLLFDADWFEEYYGEYCKEHRDKWIEDNEKNVNDSYYFSNPFVRTECLKELVDGWFKEMKEILKDYIPA